MDTIFAINARGFKVPRQDAYIITSQLPIEHWHAWVGDATIADAILDRVMQKNHRFTLTGESLRQKPKSSKKEVQPDPS